MLVLGPRTDRYLIPLGLDVLESGIFHPTFQTRSWGRVTSEIWYESISRNETNTEVSVFGNAHPDLLATE